FASMTGSLELVRGGQLRALAVTSTARTPAAPDVPPLNEFVPGYELLSWSGVGAPRNTPVEIVKRVNTEVNAFLATPAPQAKIRRSRLNRPCGLAGRARPVHRR